MFQKVTIQLKLVEGDSARTEPFLSTRKFKSFQLKAGFWESIKYRLRVAYEKLLIRKHKLILLGGEFLIDCLMKSLESKGITVDSPKEPFRVSYEVMEVPQTRNWGYTRFFKRRHLETSNFLKDDCLKINCTIVVLVSSIDSSQLNTIQVPESDIGEHFGMLLEDEESFDVTFLVGGERFHAHKLVLAAQSTMFETQFFNAMKKDDQEIVVIDMEPKVFKALLHFVYRDTLLEDEELFMLDSSFFPSLSESFIAKLLAAGEKYGLPRLMLMCESILCKDISVDSVAYIFALADRYRATHLKSICQKFSAENFDAMMHSDGFEYLKKNCPLLQSELLKTGVGCEKQFS
ncbi:hypothetical protein AAZV13_19G047900 [Glycine max]